MQKTGPSPFFQMQKGLQIRIGTQSAYINSRTGDNLDKFSNDLHCAVACAWFVYVLTLFAGLGPNVCARQCYNFINSKTRSSIKLPSMGETRIYLVGNWGTCFGRFESIAFGLLTSGLLSGCCRRHVCLSALNGLLIFRQSELWRSHSFLLLKLLWRWSFFNCRLVNLYWFLPKDTQKQSMTGN